MSRSVHVYHHKDEGDKRFWAWLEFGIPLIIYSVIVFGIMASIGLQLSNSFVFIIGLVISIFLAVLTSKKLSKLFDKISEYLNK
ncbi:hypothetical protein ACFLUF_02580 [Chloroflexota bacterium]